VILSATAVGEKYLPTKSSITNQETGISMIDRAIITVCKIIVNKKKKLAITNVITGNAHLTKQCK
jgi:hypothetical protein